MPSAPVQRTSHVMASLYVPLTALSRIIRPHPSFVQLRLRPKPYRSGRVLDASEKTSEHVGHLPMYRTVRVSVLVVVMSLVCAVS